MVTRKSWKNSRWSLIKVCISIAFEPDCCELSKPYLGLMFNCVYFTGGDADLENLGDVMSVAGLMKMFLVMILTF